MNLGDGILKEYTVAVVGATGAVGQEMIRILRERNFPVKKLKALASPRSAGSTLTVAGEDYRVELAEPASFDDVDFALFSAGAPISLELGPEAAGRGAVVIDNSSAFRMDPKVPLVVPEVNPHDIPWHNGIIANPNCSTIIMVVALKPLHDAAVIKRVVVSTYQAVSGAGYKGMAELEEQVRDYIEGRESVPKLLPTAKSQKKYQIAFNLLPHIDVFQEGGYTKEEWKMVYETAKIMGDDTIKVSATTVRVPVFRSHSESLNIEFAKKITAQEAREILSKAPGVVVQDDVANEEYPMPLATSGKDPVYVGRIREDSTVPSGLNLWVVGDQIRKGAALNAIQIAEYMVANGMK
jgi:aspartate-semialdehyde dehydrogenase